MIVVVALIGAGCGSPRTTASRNATLDEAIASYVDGDLERAEAFLTRVIREGGGDEANVTAYLYLGRIYLARGDYEKAADAFSTGLALGGDFRFAEHFAEAQRHLTTSPERFRQLPSVTRGQLAALIETMFASRLPAPDGTVDRASMDVTPDSAHSSSMERTVPGAAPDKAVDWALSMGVMTVLPDGEFHAADAVTGPAFYAVVQRLAAALGVGGEVVSAQFPGGVRGTLPPGPGRGNASVTHGSFVSGRDAYRVLDALAKTDHSGDE